MKAKILEIFQSIQGEGKYVGVSQVFVRFFECNIHCVWCDTPHSIGDTSRRYTEYGLDELMSEIKKLWRPGFHSVSLTGGEPLLQKDFIKELIPHLQKEKIPVYLETNGILYKELAETIDGIDVVAMDIKLPSSTRCGAFWNEHREFLKVSLRKDVFIKTVITSDTAKEDVLRSIEMVAGLDPRILFILQPNSFEIKNGALTKCLEFQGYCLERLTHVRILPQVHKFLKVR